jgi:hypothetical protein
MLLPPKPQHFDPKLIVSVALAEIALITQTCHTTPPPTSLKQSRGQLGMLGKGAVEALSKNNEG